MIHAKRQGGRIEIVSDLRSFSPETVEFIGSLPNSRFSTSDRLYRVDATPATAWRILEQFPVESVDCDDQTRRLALEFFNDIERDEDRLDQPAVRNWDSWEHQCRAYWFAHDRAASLLNCAMGTGKSKVIVDLVQNKRFATTLILCPVSVLGVWRREFDRHCVIDHALLVLDKRSWTAARKSREVVEFIEMQEALGKPAVVACSYESAWRMEKMFLAREWDAVILDESHKIKAHGSKVSKFCGQLAKCSKFRLAMSGTPLSNSPLDVFGQFRFLDRGIYGTSWTRFRNQFAVSGPLGDDHIVGFKNEAELARGMGLLTITIKSDVLDLPDAMDETRVVDLKPTTRGHYNELRDELITEVQEGTVTAANGLVRLLRLAQITGGFAKTEKGETISIGNEKQAALVDLLENVDRTEPVVVFCRFREDLNRIQEVAEQLGKRYGEQSGRRKDLTENATMPDDVDLLAVQIQSGGVGIDLTRARIAVYYSTGYSLGDYLQSRARIHRPGQDRPVIYYHLVAAGTVDEVVYRSLAKKEDVIESIIGALSC